MLPMTICFKYNIKEEEVSKFSVKYYKDNAGGLFFESKARDLVFY